MLWPCCACTGVGCAISMKRSGSTAGWMRCKPSCLISSSSISINGPKAAAATPPGCAPPPMSPEGDSTAAPQDGSIEPRAHELGLGRGRFIVLVGLMGAGKTSLGKRLAKIFDLPFLDSDAEIEKAAGCTIAEIFERFGEAYFRDGERRVIMRLLNSGEVVLATGGGAFMALIRASITGLSAAAREMALKRTTSSPESWTAAAISACCSGVGWAPFSVSLTALTLAMASSNFFSSSSVKVVEPSIGAAVGVCAVVDASWA